MPQFVNGLNALLEQAALAADQPDVEAVKERLLYRQLIECARCFEEGVLETPISGMKPAIAVKLVPANEYKVFIKGFSAGLSSDEINVSFTAIGEDIRAAWLEIIKAARVALEATERSDVTS